MRKLLSVVLVLCVAALFVACKAEGDNLGTQSGTMAPSGVTAPTAGTDAPAATTPTDQPDTPTADGTEPPASTGEATAPTQTPTEPEVTVDPGQTEGISYKSSFIGIGCELASGWRFYTDAEIRQLNESASILGGDAYEDALKNAQVLYDMFAVGSNGMDNINVVLEKVDAKLLSKLDIRDNFEATIPTLKETFTNMGYRNIACSIDTFWFGGEELDCLQTTAVIEGTTIYQTIFSIKCNGYLASVSVTSYGTDRTNELLGYFYAL